MESYAYLLISNSSQRLAPVCKDCSPRQAQLFYSGFKNSTGGNLISYGIVFSAAPAGFHQQSRTSVRSMHSQDLPPEDSPNTPELSWEVHRGLVGTGEKEEVLLCMDVSGTSGAAVFDTAHSLRKGKTQ